MPTKYLTKNELEVLYKYSQSYHNQSKSEYEAFRARFDDGNLIAYQSGNVVYNGNKATEIINQCTNNIWITGAGSDEVGTGDYFGPVVVCACQLVEEDQQWLSPLGITDSKKISDNKILQLAPQLISKLTFSILILDNVKYNEVQATNNLNEIKAKLHNKAYLNLALKLKKPINNAVIDQFTPAKQYFNYLKDEPQVFTQLKFETKAESKYPAVACASIIARYYFLIAMDQLSAKYQFNFPKGAGPHVDEAIKKFNQQYPNQLPNVAKIHFKNTKQLLQHKSD
jgi:ribonuclease HIII